MRVCRSVGADARGENANKRGDHYGLTVTGGLVAATVYPLFGNNRNSYCPALRVRPRSMCVSRRRRQRRCRLHVARRRRPDQGQRDPVDDPPAPLASVTVIGDPGAAVVVLTVIVGGGAAWTVTGALVAPRV